MAIVALGRPSFVSLTVLLETVWLLSSRYRLERSDIVQSLKDIGRLRTVRFEEHQRALWALDRFADGADFGDMIHLVAGRTADWFTTFDKAIAKAAGPTSPIAVELLS